MKQTDFLNKQVISIFDGKVCGKVDNFCFKNFQLSYLSIKNKNKSLLVPSKAIFAIGKNCILIKNQNFCTVGKMTNQNQFLRKPVFDVFGKSFGKVLSIYFTKNFEIEKFSCNRLTFFPKQILGFENAIIINNNTNYKKSQFAKINPKIFKKSEKNASKVRILHKNFKK